jgi:glycosyltransferase involved in cell wall biosynthesis
MMEIIAYSAIAYLIVQLLVVLVNMVTRQYLKKAELVGNPMVSILIPARDEENNIGNLLDDLSGLEYRNFEVIVYDDDSSDQTSLIVHEKSLHDQRISYTRGSGLLPGWLGKNHACHNLANQAAGEYLLFLDADVRVMPGLLSDSLAFMKKWDLELLSLFPVQKMKNLGEWLTVPIMNQILIGNLPMILIRRSQIPDFAAANGQFMLFRAETYKNSWFHKELRDEKVEDIEIIRRMKRMKLNVHTLLSGGQIMCRMYTSYGEALSGFAKNVHAFFGSNWLLLFFYVILTSIGPFAVWVALPLPALFIYLAGVIVFRIMAALLSRQSWWLNCILMPFQQASLVIIAVLAAYHQVTGKLTWKGRRIILS